MWRPSSAWDLCSSGADGDYPGGGHVVPWALFSSIEVHAPYPSVPVACVDSAGSPVVSTDSSGAVALELRWDIYTGCFNFPLEHGNVLTLYILDVVPPTRPELVVECTVIPVVARLCTWLQV